MPFQPMLHVPGENSHSHFIAFDFGICENEKGELEPQLIEMQGFPTLFAFQAWQAEVAQKFLTFPLIIPITSMDLLRTATCNF